MTKQIVPVVTLLLTLPAGLEARNGPLIPPPLQAEDIGEPLRAEDIPAKSSVGHRRPRSTRPEQRKPERRKSADRKKDPDKKLSSRTARPRPAPTVDLSGNFNDTDADHVVNQLVRSLLADRNGRLARLGRQLKRRPVLKLGTIQNRTGSHINTAVMQRRATTRLSASRALTIAKPDQGTDLLLIGYIVALNDRSGDTELRSYQVRWSVFDVVTGEKIWLGISTRRKLVKGPKVGLPRVEIVPRGRAIDLSGHFNDHDALTLGKALAGDLIRSPFLKRHGTVKRLQIRRLRNRSSEHVPTDFITVEVERALLGVRGVVLVARPDELQALQGHRALTRRGSQRLAASHVLSGWFSSATDTIKGTTHRRYLASMEAIDMTTNLKHWVAVKSVAKVFTSSGTSW